MLRLSAPANLTGGLTGVGHLCPAPVANHVSEVLGGNSEECPCVTQSQQFHRLSAAVASDLNAH